MKVSKSLIQVILASITVVTMPIVCQTSKKMKLEKQDQSGVEALKKEEAARAEYLKNAEAAQKKTEAEKVTKKPVIKDVCPLCGLG
jgi:hypothetical protein